MVDTRIIYFTDWFKKKTSLQMNLSKFLANGRQCYKNKKKEGTLSNFLKKFNYEDNYLQNSGEYDFINQFFYWDEAIFPEINPSIFWQDLNMEWENFLRHCHMNHEKVIVRFCHPNEISEDLFLVNSLKDNIKKILKKY